MLIVPTLKGYGVRIYPHRLRFDVSRSLLQRLCASIWTWNQVMILYYTTRPTRPRTMSC